MNDRRVVTCVGDLVEDVIVYVPAGVRVGTDSPARIERHRGGSAANVAVAAAVFGGASRYVGNVGGDLLGDHLIDQVQSVGVEVAGSRSGRTGSIVALVDERGERSFLTDRGAADDLRAVPHGWLADTGALHVPMYSLLADPIRATTLSMLRDGREAGAITSIDASSTGAIADAGVRLTRDLIEQLKPDYLFCNRDEADLLEITPTDRLGVVTIVKQGAEPTLLLTQAATASYDVPTIGGVVDTTGAGDAFAAAFLVTCLMRAGSHATAVAAAHQLAAATVTVPGATPKFTLARGQGSRIG